MSDNKFLYTKAFYKIRSLILDNPDEDVFVICGGQGAGKTITILQLIIKSLLSSEKDASVVSSELSKMKRTVIKDYKKICKDWGVFASDHDFNRSESKHEYPNESYIDFLGADVSDIGKGFRRDILYINEADKMDVNTAVQFISRAGLTIIDYNPDSLFWGDEYINENNFIRLTYEDNEYLAKSEVKSILEYKERGFYNKELPIETLFKEENIKNKFWANKWRVYGLGLVGSLDGVVFENWTIIDEIPKEARREGYGMDFGYTNDPTTLTDVFTWNNCPVLDEIIYETGLTNPAIARRCKEKNIDNEVYITADSAEPKSIKELSDLGLKIDGAVKGQDSIVFGLSKMQDFDTIYITRRSVNIIKEFERYTWAKDKSGNALNKPIDKWNHAIDGVRYHFNQKNPMRGNYFVY